MLFEQLEKAQRSGAGKVITATGSCKFCGQTAMHEVMESWNQEEINEIATEYCECIDAQIYTSKKEKKEHARARINLLFGEDNKSVIMPYEA